MGLAFVAVTEYRDLLSGQWTKGYSLCVHIFVLLSLYVLICICIFVCSSVLEEIKNLSIYLSI